MTTSWGDEPDLTEVEISEIDDDATTIQPSSPPRGSPTLARGHFNVGAKEPPRILSIAGWVLDHNGEPVSTIEVTSSIRRQFRAGDGTPPPSGDFGSSALTDDQGFFELGGLLEAEYDVRATDGERDAYALLRAGADSAVLTLGGPLDSAPAVTVSGVVRDSHGKNLAGVAVLASGQGARRASSDAFGRYELALSLQGRDRSYLVRFVKDGYRERRLTLSDGDLRGSDGLERDVTLAPVSKPAEVTGVVKGQDSRPIPAAAVQLYSASIGRSYRTVSGDRGEFLLAEVELASDYRLWVAPQNQDARRARFESYREEGITVPPHGLDLDLVLKPYPAGTLTGRLVDRNGRPLSYVNLSLHPSQPTTPRSLPVRSDRDGRFSVSGVPYGAVSLATRGSTFLSVTGIELTRKRGHVELMLDLGTHQVSGIVLDDQGQPVPGAKASLLWSADLRGIRSRSRRVSVVDAGGYFLFTQLGPGRHTLVVEAPGFRPAQLDARAGIGRGDIPVRLQRLSL